MSQDADISMKERKIPYTLIKAILEKDGKTKPSWAERGTELFNAPKNTAGGETKNILLSHQVRENKMKQYKHLPRFLKKMKYLIQHSSRSYLLFVFSVPRMLQ